LSILFNVIELEKHIYPSFGIRWKKEKTYPHRPGVIYRVSNKLCYALKIWSEEPTDAQQFRDL